MCSHTFRIFGLINTSLYAHLVAIKRKPLPLHLEIQRHRGNPVGLIRSSYRENGKVKHSTHGRITGLTLEQLKLVQAAFRGDVVPKGSEEDFQILASKEYGASYALLELAKELGLDRALYSRKEAWVQDCLAMIVGRIVYAGSKLALSNQWKNTALWELSGVEGKVDVDLHCYLPMDRLLERQSAIQRTLAARHLQDGHLVLYDITSSYFEGAYTQSDIVTFGYNRDGKRGHEQMVIALLCSAEGCPVGVEVFAGNTQDASTVPEKIAQLQRQYGLKEIIFVGDRGMITKTVADKIKGIEGLHTISALTHRQIVELLERKVITAELFDEEKIVEVFDPEEPKRRYCLCRNPLTAGREGKRGSGFWSAPAQNLTKSPAQNVGPVQRRWEHASAGCWSVPRWANSSAGMCSMDGSHGTLTKTRLWPRNSSMAVTLLVVRCPKRRWLRAK